MKTLKYIALSLLVAASTTACKDDPELLTTDVGPEMTVVSADASGVYGGKVDFEVTMTDRYALSTLKAQVFFDDEMVAEEVIRTKSDGTYTGAVTLPFYKNIPDGEATLCGAERALRNDDRRPAARRIASQARLPDVLPR